MPDLSLENEIDEIVAGIDEAGRGPWVGPVLASAVILGSGLDISLIKDSKKLSPAKREEALIAIENCCNVGVGLASVGEIDSLNILRATKLAMRRAFDNLPVKPGFVLVDGNQNLDLPCGSRAVVKGDDISLSIAAASIVAKVTRDRIMHRLHAEYPQYGWNSNMGYGTKQHMEALTKHGITMHHRVSFNPMREILEHQYKMQECLV